MEPSRLRVDGDLTVLDPVDASEPVDRGHGEDVGLEVVDADFAVCFLLGVFVALLAAGDVVVAFLAGFVDGVPDEVVEAFGAVVAIVFDEVGVFPSERKVAPGDVRHAFKLIICRYHVISAFKTKISLSLLSLETSSTHRINILITPNTLSLHIIPHKSLSALRTHPHSRIHHPLLIILRI